MSTTQRTRARGRIRSVVVATATVAACLGATGAPDVAAQSAPPCTVTSPTAGATVSGQTVSVKAQVPWGIDGVEFYLDGVLLGRGYDDNWRSTFVAQGTNTFGWPSTSVTNGSHTLRCRAWGPGGAGPLSPTVTFTTSNQIRTRLTAPADGATVSGTVPITLDNWVATGTNPTTATFEVDGVVVGTAPCTWWLCTFQWNSATVLDGTHIVRARATGSAGVPGTSATRRVIVNNTAPGTTLLLSEYETQGWGRLTRDGGFSRQLPGDPTKTVFTFGDGGFTPGTGPQRGQDQWRFGNSTGVTSFTPGVAPVSLQEVPNLNGDPAPPMPSPNLIPAPSVMRQPNGSPCAGVTNWTGGLVPAPNSTHLLITYLGLCGTGTGVLGQVAGIADYDPATGTAVSHDIFVDTTSSNGLSGRRLLGSPVVEGGYIYFFQADGWNVYTARVPSVPTGGSTTPWFDAARYEWRSAWSPTGWASDPFWATNIAPAFVGSPNTQVSIDRYPSLPGSPLLMILPDTASSPTDYRAAGLVDIYRATSVTGPWTLVADDVNPCPQCTTTRYNSFYSVNGHPELSTNTQLALTFYFDKYTTTPGTSGNDTKVDRVYTSFVPAP